MQQVVIIGGGFGGLYVAKSLRNTPFDVTLVDRRNFHLFQPLLYQVATGGLAPSDISSPLRTVLRHAQNVRVITAEVVDIHVARRRVILHDAELPFDILVVATGATHHYFGHDEAWAALAPGLKTVEDATTIRRRILLAFETAEREPDPEKRRALLNFVIVGAGPTGVEMAGTLAELARYTMRGEFRNIDPTAAQFVLVEGLDRVLPTYPPQLSARATRDLEKLGVTIRTNTLVEDVNEEGVVLRNQESEEEAFMPVQNVIWAAGVKASLIGKVLEREAGAELDKSGRVKVGPKLSLPGHPHIFVIGDLAHLLGEDGEPLPGVAQVAMQQGHYVAHLLRRQAKGQTLPPFRYKDKGSLAVIGRSAAVADISGLRFGGFFAWLIWVFVHIQFLVEFDNKLLVLLQWAMYFWTRKRGARLITGPDPYPVLGTSLISDQPAADDSIDQEDSEIVAHDAVDHDAVDHEAAEASNEPG
jgi:NADH dehydrogenase